MLLTLILVFTAVTSCLARHRPSPAVLPQVSIERAENDACPGVEAIQQARNDTVSKISLILHETHPSQCPCGGPGEWTRVARLNMSDPSQQCPANWTLVTTPVRSCGRSSRGIPSCHSTFFPTQSRSYSRVCGRVLAYQLGTPDAFGASIINNPGLEGIYIDGVSLTHGAAGSRQHIWSFAAVLAETDPTHWNSRFVCPCTNSNRQWPHQVPSFVGNNYFCDSGNAGPGFINGHFYSDDPLWNGAGCGPTSTCCEFNNPPWFCTTLPHPTTDDLELRMCANQRYGDDEALINVVDLYIN